MTEKKSKRDSKGRFIKGEHYNKNTEFKKGQHWRKEKSFWNRDFLYNLYITNKKSSEEIAKDFGCSAHNIIFWLKKLSIPIRNTSESRKIKHWGLKGEDNPMFNKRGESNPNWKGGLAPERQEFYQSLEWKKACSFVWKRDNAICQRCKIRWDEGVPFNIHHRVSFINKELRANANNLVLLCEVCHRFIHSKKNKNREFISEEVQNDKVV